MSRSDPNPTSPELSPPVTDVVFATGRVEGVGRSVDLAFESPGRLIGIDVLPGETVTAGQVLARLDDQEHRAALDEAISTWHVARQELARLMAGPTPKAVDVMEADVAVQDVQARHAQSTLARTERIYRGNAGSQTELESDRFGHQLAVARLAASQARLDDFVASPREEDVLAAKWKVAMAQAQVDAAQTRMAKCQLRAPHAGRVLEVHLEVGAVVNPQFPVPAVTFADDTKLHVRAYVDEYDAAAVAVGQAALVTTVSAEPIQQRGRVVLCAPHLVVKPQLRNRPEEQTDVKVREVLIELPESARGAMLLGMPVDVQLSKPTSTSTPEPAPESPQRLLKLSGFLSDFSATIT